MRPADSSMWALRPLMPKELVPAGQSRHARCIATSALGLCPKVENGGVRRSCPRELSHKARQRRDQSQCVVSSPWQHCDHLSCQNNTKGCGVRAW